MHFATAATTDGSIHPLCSLTSLDRISQPKAWTNNKICTAVFLQLTLRAKRTAVHNSLNCSRANACSELEVQETEQFSPKKSGFVQYLALAAQSSSEEPLRFSALSYCIYLRLLPRAGQQLRPPGAEPRDHVLRPREKQEK